MGTNKPLIYTHRILTRWFAFVINLEKRLPRLQFMFLVFFMTFSLHVLGSSSSGNCGLLKTAKENFLVDAGFSGKRIQLLLQPFQLKLSDISGVFITHEHTDHILGLKALMRYPRIRFFANHGTAAAIEKKHKLSAPWCLFETGKSFYVHEMEANAFSVPHDACEPVGFVFRLKKTQLNGHYNSFAWVTDLGHVNDTVSAAVKDVDGLVFESNHESEWVKNHPTRPWHLKQRILGMHGHLSNEATYAFFDSLSAPQWKSVCLAHLSKDCNSFQLVLSYFEGLAQKKGFSLKIIDPRSADLMACTA